MVKAVEQVKEEVMPEKSDPIKHVLDCGYASEKNLAELEDLDLYMPDREFAREIGGKVKPEDRKNKTEQLLKFEYIPDKDILKCPNGDFLAYCRNKVFNKTEYRVYRKNGCHKCHMTSDCSGDKARKEVHIPLKNYQSTKYKMLPHYGEANKTRMSPIGGFLTLLMREKLKSELGKKTYSRRFEVSEGVFGVIKEIRGASEFLRRGLEKVQIEWTERCIAHNVAKLLQFRRV